MLLWTINRSSTNAPFREKHSAIEEVEHRFKRALDIIVPTLLDAISDRADIFHSRPRLLRYDATRSKVSTYLRIKQRSVPAVKDLEKGRSQMRSNPNPNPSPSPKALGLGLGLDFFDGTSKALKSPTLALRSHSQP